MTSPRVWMFLVKTTNRTFGGNLGYEDTIYNTYQWDDTVPNYNKVKVGDIVVLRDGKASVGISVINSIQINEAQSKIRRRCPFCNSTKIYERTSFSPEFKCQDKKCLKEFGANEVIIQNIPITKFKANYSNGWLDLIGRISVKGIKDISISSGSQHSIRLLSWDKLKTYLDDYEIESISKTRELILSSLPG